MTKFGLVIERRFESENDFDTDVRFIPCATKKEAEGELEFQYKEALNDCKGVVVKSHIDSDKKHALVIIDDNGMVTETNWNIPR